MTIMFSGLQGSLSSLARTLTMLNIQEPSFMKQLYVKSCQKLSTKADVSSGSGDATQLKPRAVTHARNGKISS